MTTRMKRIEELKQAATMLDDPPRYESGNEVRLRGDPLDTPIYWQGRQWAVTPRGVEARDGTYVVQAHRLWEEEDVYGWVRHMAEKSEWVDIEDFVEALRVARRRQREGGQSGR